MNYSHTAGVLLVNSFHRAYSHQGPEENSKHPNHTILSAARKINGQNNC